jgi:hypothetical protein
MVRNAIEGNLADGNGQKWKLTALTIPAGSLKASN